MQVVERLSWKDTSLNKYTDNFQMFTLKWALKKKGNKESYCVYCFLTWTFFEVFFSSLLKI